MDASSSTGPGDLPHLVWRHGCDGLAQHAIRQSKPVSDDAARLFDGMSGRSLPFSSGSAHGHLGPRSLCCQADRIVLLVRAAVARILRPCEATRTGILVDFVWVGNSGVAVRDQVGTRGGKEMLRVREVRLMACELCLDLNLPNCRRTFSTDG